jgi:hypothetical protein
MNEGFRVIGALGVISGATVLLPSSSRSNVIGTMVIEPMTIDSAAGTDAFGPNVLERRDTAIAALLGNPKVKASTAPSGMDMPTR